MTRRKAKSEEEKSIDEIADELASETVRGMCKDGKLTPQGRSLAKLMDRIMPDEKVDEWDGISRARNGRRSSDGQRRGRPPRKRRKPRRVPARRIGDDFRNERLMANYDRMSSFDFAFGKAKMIDEK